MKVIIAGSRNLANNNGLEQIHLAMLQSPFFHDISEVISGTARGVDRAGEDWATSVHLPVIRFPANWEAYGKRAGYIRNIQMAQYADALVAIWDGESRGTKHMIDTIITAQKPYYIHKVVHEV